MIQEFLLPPCFDVLLESRVVDSESLKSKGPVLWCYLEICLQLHWSVDPPQGRILQSNDKPCIMMDSESRNLFSLVVTWWCASLLLFQVNWPLLVLMSTSSIVSMKAENYFASLSNLRLPPFFSAKVVIMLKSLAKIGRAHV